MEFFKIIFPFGKPELPELRAKEPKLNCLLEPEPEPQFGLAVPRSRSKKNFAPHCAKTLLYSCSKCWPPLASWPSPPAPSGRGWEPMSPPPASPSPFSVSDVWNTRSQWKRNIKDVLYARMTKHIFCSNHLRTECVHNRSSHDIYHHGVGGVYERSQLLNILYEIILPINAQSVSVTDPPVFVSAKSWLLGPLDEK